MGDFVLRPYEEARDAEGFRHVRSVAFRHGETVSPEDRLLRDDCTGYIGELDGTIVAATTAISMTASRSGVFLPCAGLAAVGVVPEKRRGGLGSAMMSQILAPLKQQGFTLASLYPFRGAYYRRFGYEYCGSRYKVVCPAERLPRFRDAQPVRLLAESETANIYQCYEEFCRRYNGMSLRDKDQWWRVLGGDTPMQIYAVGDPVAGYAVLRLNSDFWVHQPIKEMIWNSDIAYRSLLTFFGSLAINKTAVEWREPQDSPFFQSYMDQGVQLTQADPIMFRLLDVPAALTQVKVKQQGEFSFKVVDDQMPENRGPWSVCFDESGVRIEHANEFDFEIGIGSLTQAFLGEPGLDRLFRNGKVQAGAEARAAAEAFFQPHYVYCTDFF